MVHIAEQLFDEYHPRTLGEFGEYHPRHTRPDYQVNLSSPGSTAPVDHWHNDSIAFAGVVVLSDMEVVTIFIQAGSDLIKA